MIDGDANKNLKTWSTRFGCNPSKKDDCNPSVRNPRGLFTGALYGTGELQMTSSVTNMPVSKYVVALGVGDWTYYYDADGISNCRTPAPKAADQFLALDKVTVYKNQ